MRRMVRKQIYIERQQAEQLKRLAKQRGVSESEIVRSALDRELDTNLNSDLPRNRDAWNEALEFKRSLRVRGPDPEQRYDWKREDAYEERLERLYQKLK